MAEEQEEVQEQENETVQKKSSNLVLIIVIVVLIFTLIIGGVIVAMLLSGDDDMPQQQSQQQSQMQDSGNNNSDSVRPKATARIVDIDVGPMFPLDGFTINLLSDSGRRYLKSTINLELRDEESAEELEQKAPVIRDVMIRVMTSKTLEEIATAKGKDKLKDQLVNQINLRLRDAEVKNIYFVEFVIQ
jgi:flagellar protein FliL